MFGAFTSFGKLGSLARAIAAAWTPSALWPTGTEAGMWIDPSNLAASWADYLGTTPVSTPGTVADASNPVGLARDLRSGNPPPLGPELVVDGDFSDGASWNKQGNWTVSGGSAHSGNPSSGLIYRDPITPVIEGALYAVTVESSGGQAWVSAGGRYHILTFPPGTNTKYVTGWGGGPYPWVGIEAENDVSIASISVKEIPGNHMLQATSTARPLLSARVNLLTYTEDFGNAVWVIDGVVTKTLNQIDPNGGTAAVRLESAGNPGLSWSYALRYNSGLSTEQSVRSWWIKSNTGDAYSLSIGDTAITTAADTDWHRYTVSENLYSWGTRICLSDGGPVDITVAFPQRERGSVGTPYQPILTDGSSYSSTGITPFQLYDGVDDGMATASFAAGTLIDGMDCQIPVRRDSGANCVAGLYNGVADATKFFGMAESASGSGCVGSGAGTPTVWVDNTQLTGGTAVTRGTLHTALTAGSYHILEFRNLDLSAWTATGFGLYTSYVFPGARGDIMLFESTASTEDKDKARQYLADKYGVTLA